MGITTTTKDALALAPDETVSYVGTAQFATVDEMIEFASSVATSLARIIDQQRLYAVIGGKRYVRVEGWETLGSMVGLAARCVRATEIEEGIFEAEVVLVRMRDGTIIGGAVAECGAPDELDRHGKPMWSDRPRSARKSMAITRATGKAYRLALAWIIALAGYQTTPAEEMEVIEGTAAPLSGEGNLEFDPYASFRALALKERGRLRHGDGSERIAATQTAEERLSRLREALSQFGADQAPVELLRQLTMRPEINELGDLMVHEGAALLRALKDARFHPFFRQHLAAEQDGQAG